MKKNRIIVIADEGEVLWESLILPEQQTEIYLAKNIQDALSHLTVFSYHLILIAVKQEPEIALPTCRNYPKDGDNTCDRFIAGSF